MESEKIVIILLVIAILFSMGSTIINLSLLNMEFNPVSSVSGSVIGSPESQINLIVEGNPISVIKGGAK